MSRPFAPDTLSISEARGDAPRRARRARRPGLASAGLAVVLLAGSGCGSGPESGPGSGDRPAPAVSVQLPEQRTVTEWEEATGRLAAVDTVEVRARVSGFIDDIHFEEGSRVRKGQRLVTLDPRVFRAQVRRLGARRDEAQVRLELARAEAARIEPLVERRAVSEQEADRRRRDVESAAASLAAAEADLAAAELDLEFTEVRAPIDGRIGQARIERGNLVTGGTGTSSVLTTVVSTDPIEMYWTPDETVARRLLQLKETATGPLPVEMQLGSETDFPRRGTLDFLDNRIDEETGTLLARAVFPNPDGDLLPGMFARLRVRLDEPREALLVPRAALGLDQTQRILLVAGPDDIVERRRVEVGPTVGDLQVIRSGLSPGDRVIVDGLQSATPGSPVRPEAVETEPDASGASSDAAEEDSGPTSSESPS